MGIAIFIFLGIPILFVISLVKFIKTKRKVWLFFLILSGIPLSLLGWKFAEAVIVGFEQGYNQAELFQSHTETPEKGSLVPISDTSLSLVLPETWSFLTGINDVAVLEVGNLYDEQYLIVLLYNKLDFEGGLAGINQRCSDDLLSALTNAEQSEIVQKSFGDTIGVQAEFSGSIESLKLNYLQYICEDDTYYFQFIAWTLPSKKSKAFQVFENTLNTLTFTK